MDNQALERSEPFLVYLLRSFYAIAQYAPFKHYTCRNQDLGEISEGIKAVVKCVRSVYRHLPLQREIWTWFAMNLNLHGGSHFVEFFQLNLAEHEQVTVSSHPS